MLGVAKQSLKRSVLRQAIASQPPHPQLREVVHDALEDEASANDFILSILHAAPSARDSKSYLKSFGPQPKRFSKPTDPPEHRPLPSTVSTPSTIQGPSSGSLQPQKFPITDLLTTSSSAETSTASFEQEVLSQILDPVTRHTGLIKLQGPFTDIQLESICRGMVYLEKLGLVSVIVVENDEWTRGMEGERRDAVEEVRRVTRALEAQGTRTRPIIQPVARLGPKPGDEQHAATADAREKGITPPEAHALPEDLGSIRSALLAGEIPVLAPFALDSFCRTVRIDADYVVAALARGMVEAAQLDDARKAQQEAQKQLSSPPSPSADGSTPGRSRLPYGVGEFDMTPFRLMIINREGGLPSYARSGFPHLLINLSSEFQHIHSTFRHEWETSHPTALSNLRLAQACLGYMPPSASAIVVSHRSSRSLIANLITNKPERSSSLPHALLTGGPKKVTRHTPTLIRSGFPIRVIRDVRDVDMGKMTVLLETSFGRKLNEEAFYKRLKERLDFVIVAGDWAGVAVVTNEGPLPSSSSLSPSPNENESISYLDKFAVLPSHQGDGTVDFLWVALHDESYGLGLASALNPNVGGRQGRGVGRDLVWRSRAGNPVNGWYFERSTGHKRIVPLLSSSSTSSSLAPREDEDAKKVMGKKKGSEWVLFWCDAEERLRVGEEDLRISWEKELEEHATEEMRGRRVHVPGLSWLVDEEEGRLEKWEKIVSSIPSSWAA